MKQNCYILRGVAECRNAATPLSSYSINDTHQGFQKRYITLLYLKGLKSYQPSKFKCLRFTPLSLVNRTFHLLFCWYLLKALMCGINAVGAQGCGCMSTFCHAPLKIAVLLHKTANVSHSFSGTVCSFFYELFYPNYPSPSTLSKWVFTGYCTKYNEINSLG